jgi:uroporphyrinogen III methyltransferase/synthase
LLTRRGEALLRQADVVVYDRLVSDELLELVGTEVERVYVGKQPGRHSMRQEQINQLLVDLGRAGRRVVRLKGGDPFVFGRGGEEALALQAAGVPFEVVPGVTSAIAAPAYAGIPITHRGLSTSVTIATGHEDPTKSGSSLDWSTLGRGADTLVFLMGVEQLSTIVSQLLANGRREDEPAALIRWGTTPEQEVLTARLGSIVEQARERAFAPPAVLVVGAVVDLANVLAWKRTGVLAGKTVLVTRAREQASALSAQLAALGARPLEYPTIRIAAVQDSSELDGALDRLSGYQWVIFTSVNGVRATFERLAQLGRDARAFGGAQVGAIGPATAAALRERGIRADFIPEAFTSDAIAAELGGLIEPGARVLLLRADIAPLALVEALKSSGASADNVVAYRTVPDLADREELRRLLREQEIDIVTFTSSSTVKNLVEGLGADRGLLAGCLVACIGPVTARKAQELGLEVDLVAPVHTVDGLIQALVERFETGKLREEARS